MKRYVSRPRNWHGEWTNEPEPPIPTMTVIEADTIRNTGLLDQNGNALWAVDDRQPVGFMAAHQRTD